MSAATTPKFRKVRRRCPNCQKSFWTRAGGGANARIYCTTCSPPTAVLKSRRLAPVIPITKVAGRPFTVAHFKRWSRKMKLKDGSDFKLEDWQAAFLVDLFARGKDGRPRYGELWLVVPEGNGKTTFFALVILYTLEHSKEAWCPVAASARDQAVDLTYRIGAGFVTRNGLTEAYRLHPGYRQIVHNGTQSAAKIFASDAASGDGVDPTLALIEELHRLNSMDLYETWAGKLDKSGGQLVVATTRGEPGSPFEQLLESIRRQASDVKLEECFTRAVGGSVVMHEWALPENGDPEDIRLVAKANPSPRKTVASLKAKREKPTWRLNHWLRFTCNRPARSDQAAITEREWHGARVEDDIPEGEPIWLGLDVGWKWDTTAAVPLWIPDPEYRLLGAARVLVPPRDGTSLDPHAVERTLTDIHVRNPIHTVVMDMTRAEQLGAWIEEELGAEVVDRSQTNKFAVLDYEKFMGALRSGWLKHTGDPVLQQHALNAVAKMLPQGDTRFARVTESRDGQQEGRVIDALVAAAMVHTTAAAEIGDEEIEPLVASL